MLSGIGIVLGILSAAQALAAKGVTDEFQHYIVRLYSEGRCSEIRKISKGVDLSQLRPNVKAIAAYCEPPDYDPEDLFTAAEEANPTGDLIIVLHAKYHEKKRDFVNARPLWQRVLMIARNDYFRVMAHEHLSGAIAPGTAASEKPLNLSPDTGFARLVVGGINTSNAQTPDFVYLPQASSLGLLSRADVSLRRWYPFGSLAMRYRMGYDRYFTASQYNLMQNNVEVPVAIQIAAAKDLVIRPFTGYSLLGSNPYRFHYGLGVIGAVIHPNYKQSVQGMVFEDRIFIGDISSQQGAHYRFEYDWEFYPESWVINTTFAVEHVSATPATVLFGNAGFFEMSHTDLEGDMRFERDLGLLTVGFVPRFKYRVDSSDSQYVRRSDGVGITKHREDWDVALRWQAYVPIFRKYQIVGWYEWRRIFSNIGPDDYIDRNYRSETVGVAIRTSLSTY
jgi:hypothetical protein